MPSIRIGAVSYLNTHPLVWGLERGLGGGRLELSYDVPAVLADRMRRGELDVALLPVVELARVGPAEIVPGLGITTHGPARSVLLVSKLPVEQVASVALDPESRTSNALVRLLFEMTWRREPSMAVGPRDLVEALASADAAVRIGDKALFETPPPGAHVHDLGATWTAATGLPFVFAAWIARPGVVDREVYRALHDSRREGGRNLARIAADYRWRGEPRTEIAASYLRENIRFRLGGDEMRALRLFLEGCARLGVIEAVPEIRMALERRTECHEAAERIARFVGQREPGGS